MASSSTQVIAESTPDTKSHKLSTADYGKHLKHKANVVNAVIALSSALAVAGKGSYLIFPHPSQPGEYFHLNNKHMRSIKAWLTQYIMDDKKVFRDAKKKKRANSDPSSLRGTFSPVYAGEALRAFFNNNPGGFGPANPEEAARTQEAGEALMDKLPLIKEGLALRNSITILYYLYVRANGLQMEDNASFTKVDDHWRQCFGGNIPATFFLLPSEEDGSKPPKILMTQAVKDKLTPKPLNTFDAMRRVLPDFNPEEFNACFFQNIAAANYIPRGQLDKDPKMKSIADRLADPAVRAAMLEEHNIIKAANEDWKRLVEPARKQKREANKLKNKAAKAAKA